MPWKRGLLAWHWHGSREQLLPVLQKCGLSQEFPFPSGKPALVFPAPGLVSMGQGFSGLHVCWGREIQWELKSFGKRAVVERVLRETKQLPVCGWKILLGVGE